MGLALVAAAGAQTGDPFTPTGTGTQPECLRDDRTACLLDGRFEVTVLFATADASGDGRIMSFAGARAESDQSAFYYFFDPANFEMGVKMVDACVPPFDKYWVFVSGLTNQAFTVGVRDSVSGATKTYTNELGLYPQTVGDTAALDCVPRHDAGGSGTGGDSGLGGGAPEARRELADAPRDIPRTGDAADGACVRDDRTACLLAGRFEVRVDFETATEGGPARVMSFTGQRTETDQSVFYYFFDNANFEMGVKMVDACVPPFDRFWIFVSGLTNQGYTVTVRDTVGGGVKSYSNQLGDYPQTIGDTDALPCP
jgi:hypothetical protein